MAVSGRALDPEQTKKLRGHLRALMTLRGWDQRAAGAALGVSQQTISALVNGRTGTGFPLALAIARELGLPVEEVLNTVAVAAETPDPYPNRTAALAFLRGEVADEVVAVVEAMDVGRDRSRLWWCLRIALERDSIRDATPTPAPTRKKPALTMPAPPDEGEPLESETKRKSMVGRR